jgi:hypothetical protein
MSNDSRSYDMSAACVKWWEKHLVSELKDKGCDQIEFSGGDSGKLSFISPQYPKNGQFVFYYSFSDSSMEITIIESPSMLTYDEIFLYIGKMLPKCDC